MTSDAAAADLAEPQPLFCYRHPDRETWIRCGRCDQPICLRCAMQGPVGMRCKSCGKPSRDPLTALTLQQLVLGLLVAVGAGTVGGYIGLQTGFFFAIFLGPVAGGLICEAVMRVTGYKRGPRMYAIVFGGILVGVLIAAGIYVRTFYLGFGLPEDEFPVDMLLSEVLTGGLVYAIAAMIGAYSRFR